MMNHPAPAALTLSQRFHFDAFGFVLLRGVLSIEEISAMKEALLRIKRDENRLASRIYVNADLPHLLHIGNLVEYDPALLAYAAHPKLVPIVQELVGGEVRLEETEAIINRRDPDFEFPKSGNTIPSGFHAGANQDWGTYLSQGRFHCLFVKTLAFLTDVGPDDGGTALIPGSHKMPWEQEEMILAAKDDPSLILQIEANAGDVLVFAESLIHSTTAIRSDRERVILVNGYVPTMMREWPGNEISPEFAATLPEERRRLIAGTASWPWRRSVA